MKTESPTERRATLISQIAAGTHISAVALRGAVQYRTVLCGAPLCVLVTESVASIGLDAMRVLESRDGVLDRVSLQWRAFAPALAAPNLNRK